MKILIIEDDDFKLISIEDFLHSLIQRPLISKAKNLVDAIRMVNGDIYDFIIVDMAIPSHPVISGEGSPISLLTGGLDVLLELKYLKRKDKCIIVTQYPEIEISGQFFLVSEAKTASKILLDFHVHDCIEYSEENGLWKEKMYEALLKK